MKRRGLMLIALSLVLGAVAAVTANNWLNSRLEGSEATGEVVIAAALEIPYGTKVASRHLRRIELPEGMAPPTAYRAFEEIEGHVAKATIEPGEVLVRSRFVEHDQGSTLAALIEENMRAVTVRVDDVVGVAGFLLPGNRVDVLSIRGGQARDRAISDTVLHNVRVLAVDQTTAVQENDPIIVRAVTLELTPPQALVLVKAKAEGKIHLTLRNPIDDQVALAEPEPKPAPVVKPKPVAKRTYVPSTGTTVQVIRGTRIAKEKTKI